MKLDRIRRWGLTALFAGSSVFAAIPAAPGVVNFVEGQSRLNGNSLTATSGGSAQLQQGSVLETGTGRVEVLLSPGVFLRLGHNSAVRMVSPELLDTRVQLLRGNALIEAADLKKDNQIRVLDEGSQTTLLKKGLYRFNADNDTVAVYDGKAKVMSDDRTVELKGGHETNLNGPPVDQKFNKKETAKQDELYSWSKLRSEYLSEASALTARTYYVNNWGFPGSGWYWNPWYRTYAWMPGDSLFYSPFGAAYYSPFAFSGPVYWGPTYVYRGPRGHRGIPSGGGPVVRPGGGPGSGGGRVGSGGGTFHPGINPGLAGPRGGRRR